MIVMVTVSSICLRQGAHLPSLFKGWEKVLALWRLMVFPSLVEASNSNGTDTSSSVTTSHCGTKR